MSIEQIAKDFSKTIFWNYGIDWPGDENKEQEEALAVTEREGPADEGYDERFISFASGEISVTVAEMKVAKPSSDAECWPTDPDAHFIAKLPVYIPAMLAEIDRLRDADERSESLCRELCVKLGNALADGKLLREAMREREEEDAKGPIL